MHAWRGVQYPVYDGAAVEMKMMMVAVTTMILTVSKHER
jgi:hypothetical protein